MSNTQVKQSNIHGKGLFAATKIRAGDVIGHIKGRQTKKDGPYVLWFDLRPGNENALRVTCDFRFINHSRQCNVAYYDDRSVVALKNISPGEELTHNYGPEWS